MANLITILRLPVLLVIILLLYTPSPEARLASMALVGVLILMDTLDGVVARARHQVSLLGSVLDIMVDRAVELVLWIVYADLRLVPVAIPIVFAVRGTIVDSLRSVHVSAGQAPFKSMHTRIGGWLVGSPAMRTSYAVIKLISFAGLAFTHALAAYAERGAIQTSALRASHLIFQFTSWIALVLCIARGLPVVIEALLPMGNSKTWR